MDTPANKVSQGANKSLNQAGAKLGEVPRTSRLAQILARYYVFMAINII